VSCKKGVLGTAEGKRAKNKACRTSWQRRKINKKNMYGFVELTTVNAKVVDSQKK